VGARIGRYRHLALDNFRLRWWEAGQGPTLLFLHGGGLPVDTFVEFREKLARSFHVLAPDLPGWGRSDLPGPQWVYEDFASLIEKFLQSRGATVSCLVGYSIGGGIALTLAPRLPALTRLVLLSPGVDRRAPTRGTLISLVAAEAVQGLAQAARGHRLRVYLRVVWGFTINFVRRPYAQYRILRVIVRSLGHAPARLAVAVPTLIVSVKGDRFFRPESAQWLSERIVCSTLEIAAGIHLWVLIDHERAAQAVIRHAR
jgi:pimeloyl-ACP methyl ester carboxylesterase